MHERTRARVSEMSEVSTMMIMGELLARWRRLLGLPVLAVVVVAAMLVTGRKYVATASFMPEVRTPPSQLAGLAAQIGFSLGDLASGESIDFYADLLQSRAILQPAVLARYPTSVGERTLVEIFEVDSDTPAETMAGAMGELRSMLRIQTDPRAGVVRYQLRGDEAALVESVASRLLLLVGEFNRTTRRSRAAAERTFIEDRVEQTERELAEAEDELQRFLDGNRRVADSPQLQFELGRLQRKVNLQQQVFVTLNQAYEQARVEEVRDTPVLTVIDQPQDSAILERGLGTRLALVFGAMLALTIGWVLFQTFMREEVAAHQDDWQRISDRLGRASKPIAWLMIGSASEKRPIGPASH